MGINNMAKNKLDISKEIYPKYMGFIVGYACLFVTIGVFFARCLDGLFPEFDINNPRKRLVLYVEVLIQIASIAVITYIFREFTDYFVKSIPFLDKHNFGSPGKF